MKKGKRQGRCKFPDFSFPVSKKRCRYHQERPGCRMFLPHLFQIRQHFYGLTKTHIIGQTHAKAHGCQCIEPAESHILIGTERSFQCFRHRHGPDRSGVLHGMENSLHPGPRQVGQFPIFRGCGQFQGLPERHLIAALFHELQEFRKPVMVYFNPFSFQEGQAL